MNLLIDKIFSKDQSHIHVIITEIPIRLTIEFIYPVVLIYYDINFNQDRINYWIYLISIKMFLTLYFTITSFIGYKIHQKNSIWIIKSNSVMNPSFWWAHNKLYYLKDHIIILRMHNHLNIIRWTFQEKEKCLDYPSNSFLSYQKIMTWVSLSNETSGDKDSSKHVRKIHNISKRKDSCQKQKFFRSCVSTLSVPGAYWQDVLSV